MGGMTRWLSEDEQRLWRGWLAASMLLPERLNRDLQEQHGLTGTDYQVLVELSESPERRMRMSTLAERTQLSRSRLSHQIDRMTKAGLVTRAGVRPGRSRHVRRADRAGLGARSSPRPRTTWRACAGTWSTGSPRSSSRPSGRRASPSPTALRAGEDRA